MSPETLTARTGEKRMKETTPTVASRIAACGSSRLARRA